MLRRIFPVIAAAFLLSVAAHAAAQSPQPEAKQEAQEAKPAAATQSPPVEESADLSITANVTARELKFEVVPNPDVKFTGQPERKTVWEASRQNLPEQVQPGVTYRNIGIRLKIVSVFADIDRIVAEALGETPITDNIPPPATERAPQNTQPATARQSPATTAQPTAPASSPTAPARKGRP
jgi:hypothetical protein